MPILVPHDYQLCNSCPIYCRRASSIACWCNFSLPGQCLFLLLRRESQKPYCVFRAFVIANLPIQLLVASFEIANLPIRLLVASTRKPSRAASSYHPHASIHSALLQQLLPDPGRLKPACDKGHDKTSRLHNVVVSLKGGGTQGLQ